MSNIHTLGSGNRNAKDNKDGEEFGVGGAQSGTAVLRRPRPNGPNDDSMDALIRQAKSQKSQGGKEEDKSIGRITIYKNGFKLGEDGEFRDRKVPANEQFVQTLLRGETPPELQQMAQKRWGPQLRSVGVSLVNQSNVVYTPPPEKFSFAKSQGSSLGTTSSSSAPISLSSLRPMEYKVNSARQKANIQLVLKPRRRVVLQVNHDATVAQVFQHVMFLSNSTNFQLMAGYPPKPITNLNQTVQEAQLLNSSIQQR